MKYTALVPLTLFVCATISNADSLQSFAAAKKNARIIFAERRSTLYCRCKYDKHGKIKLNSCGMTSARNLKRAKRMEWEHIMPAENFGRQLVCWREPVCKKKNGKAYRGRRCCQKISSQFRKMEGELYNLWPSVGAVNQARSNYRYGLVPKSLKANSKFPQCQAVINKNLRVIEPSNEAKGIVARASLFMARRYNIRLSKTQRKLFESWNQKFLPSPWEINWARKVSEIEGYQNPYIQQAKHASMKSLHIQLL